MARRTVAFTALLVALACAAMPRGIAFEAHAAAPTAHAPTDTTLTIGGLASPARIVTDRYGIPHLEAATLYDLYFAWGFVSARDRLWEMESNRRAARGTTWEWLGNSALLGDGGAQLFELDAHARAAWLAARRDPDAAMPLERYAAGVNAWLALCRQGRRAWPVEFARVGHTPPDWEPSDAFLLLLAQGVFLDLELPELDEGRQIRAHGAAWMAARERFEDQWMYDTVPDSAARRLYGAAPAPGAAPTRLGARPDDASSPALGAAGVLATRAHIAWRGWLPERTPDDDQRASNVFAVGSGRSASGAPLLANDPHLALGASNPLHVIHVTVPGVVDAAGACVPGLPAIVSGRNARCAWGVTALGADVVDVYADTLSRDGRRVRWKGGWVPVRVADYRMRYRVLGIPLPPFGQSRRYTPHGPVVAYDRARRLALSVRWSALEDTLRIARLLGIERSGSATEVCAHFRALRTPCLNVVAADRDGGVRYLAVGAVPRRGFTPAPGPLPGDGRHEWKGLLGEGEMPEWSPPRAGFVVNANNRPVGAPFPEPWPRFAWAHDRALRMAQRLAGDPSLTVADARSVQNDVLSRGALRVVPRLLACIDSAGAGLDARTRAVLDTLRHWDGTARRGSVAPTLYRGWYGALLRRSDLAGHGGLALAALEGRAPEALRVPAPRPGSPPGPPERPALAARNALMLAIDSLTALLGPDVATWTWGRAHQARFDHALGDAFAPPAVPMDGDNSTVSVGPSRLPWSTRVGSGPVFRHIVDLADTAASLVVLPPGNSGDPASPHHTDQSRRWALHAYVPLVRDWKRIPAIKESELKLVPAAR